MICQQCGRVYEDEFQFCPECGNSKNNPFYGINNPYNSYYAPKQEGRGLAICALVFSILGGWVGLILSIIGLCTCKDDDNKKLCKIGLGFCIFWVILGIILALTGNLKTIG